MIKPYYDHGNIQIFHGDCLEIMPQLKPVDLVLTDPDYNAKDIGPNKRNYINQTMGIDRQDYILFCKSWFKLASQLTENLVFTPGISNTHNYPQPYWTLCWHKPAAVSFNRMGGYNAWEPIFVYGKPFKRLPQDYLYCNTFNFKKGPETGHPCPKPIPLMHKIISYMKDGAILDPFMGSGTTLVAAKNLGRRAIGIEIELDYVKIAIKRLKQEVLPFQ